ncbi:MAG: YdcH family protein [Alphaproteobacteria bacterium]|tara:strand:- start:166 stop:366 length:201 start_codon:yes stop_codon:yes gene_type:complete
MNDSNKLIETLKNFEQEHRDLDEILIQLQEKKTVDFLQIQRLKKRKLVLKDKIIDIRNKIEPDIIA